MLTLFKWLAGLILTLAVLIVIAIVVIPQVVDPNDYRDKITELVKDKTGRDLRLDGDLSVSVFPWLGVRTQGLSLSQPAQIGGDMLTVDTAQIRVKLLPLLSKKVEVDTVVLETPKVRLVTLANGVGSFDGLSGDSSDSDGGDGDTNPASAAAVVIQGLALTDGNLTYDNRQEGQLYEVRELNLVTGNLIGNSLADIKASGILIDSANPDNTSFSLDGKAKIDVDNFTVRAEDFRAQAKRGEQSVDARFAALDFSQQSSEVSIQELSADVAAARPINAKMDSLRVNLDSQAATVDRLVLKSGDAEAVVTDFIASKIFDAPSARGRIDVAPFNAAELVREYVPDFDPSDSQALKSVALNADFSGSLNSAGFKNLKLSIDDSQLVGSASIENFENPRMTFDLNLDQLNLDRYLPESEEGGGAEQASASNASALAVPMAAFRDINANGSFKAKQLVSGGLELNNVDVVVKSTPSNVTITPRASLYDGSLDGQIVYSESNGAAKLNVKNEVDLVSIAKLFNAADISDQLSGIGTLAIDMIVTEANGIQNNEGTIKLSAKNGTIKGIDIKGMVDKAYGTYRQLSGRPEKEEEGFNNKSDETKFAELLGTFNLKNNKLTNNDFSMKAPLFRVSGEGGMDLETQTVDYLLKVAIVNSSSGQGGEALDKLKGITLPVRLSGDISAPKYSLDMKVLYSSLVKSKVKEKKTEFLQEKLGIEGGENLSTKDLLKKGLLDRLTKDKKPAADEPAPIYDPESKGNVAAPEVKASPEVQTAEEAPVEDNRTGKEKRKDAAKELLRGLFD